MLMSVCSFRHYLFQAGGINDDETLRDLDLIDFSVANEPSAPAVDTDLEVSGFGSQVGTRLARVEESDWADWWTRATSEPEKNKTSFRQSKME